MPTRTVDAYAHVYEERSPLKFARNEWPSNRNDFGIYSHATEDVYGELFDNADGWNDGQYAGLWPTTNGNTRAPYLPYGWRHGGFATQTRVTYWQPEGVHETNAQFIFKDLDIPQGATITSASMYLCPTQGTAVYQDSSAGRLGPGQITYGPYFGEGNLGVNFPWKFKIYAVAEDDACGRMVQCPTLGYNMTAQDRYYHPNRYPRRYRVDSFSYNKQHTQAIVYWNAFGPGGEHAYPWNGWVTSPNIAAVIQEIVNRPGWKPLNRICLIIGPHDMMVNANTPAEAPPRAYGIVEFDETMYDFNIDWGAAWSAYTCPTLTVAYT